MVCGRPSLVDLRRDQIDFGHAVLHVRRAKKGTPATHPVVGDEMRALRKLQREQDPKSPFVLPRRNRPVILRLGLRDSAMLRSALQALIWVGSFLNN